MIGAMQLALGSTCNEIIKLVHKTPNVPGLIVNVSLKAI